MLNKILLAGTALAALSATAFAADLPSRKEPVAAPLPVFTWTGFYVGGTAGLVQQSGTAKNVGDTEYDYWYPGDRSTTTGTGFLAGVTAGYNYQIGNIVVGAEADFSLPTANKATNTTYEGYVVTSSTLNSLGTIRARAGYSFGRALLFATGGLAIASVHNSVYDYEYYQFNGNKTLTGWTLGGGLEYAVTNNWTVKVEGLYYDLAKKTPTTSASAAGCGTSFKNTGTLARVGVNYKF